MLEAKLRSGGAPTPSILSMHRVSTSHHVACHKHYYFYLKVSGDAPFKCSPHTILCVSSAHLEFPSDEPSFALQVSRGSRE